MPTGRDVVVNVAVPADSVDVPIAIEPLKKATAPVAEEGVTVAVKVTLPPATIEEVEAEREVLVGVDKSPQATANKCASTEPRPVT